MVGAGSVAPTTKGVTGESGDDIANGDARAIKATARSGSVRAPVGVVAEVVGGVGGLCGKDNGIRTISTISESDSWHCQSTDVRTWRCARGAGAHE